MISQLLHSCRFVLISAVVFIAFGYAVGIAQETNDTESGEQANDIDAEGSSGTISVPLSGRGLISRNSNLSVSETTLDLGLVDVGDSMTRTLSIRHSGADDSAVITIDSVTLIGQNTDEFSTDFNGTTLIPGQSVDVNVTLTPFSPGKKAAALRMSILDATSPYVLVFTGQSRYPLTSELASSQNTLNLGEILQNDTVSATFTLINEGEPDAPAINISGIELSGTNANDFTVDYPALPLTPGDELQVSVTLDTSTAGFKSATATVTHDGINDQLPISLQGTVNEPEAVPVNFSLSTLDTSRDFDKPTTLQFGPDDRLYVGEMDGDIHIFDVQRNGKDNYSATLIESIDLVRNVPNHNDDGSDSGHNIRLVTGLHVAGTANAPVIYLASSDPRQAAGPSGRDSNLDTNSGILHKLSQNGGNWTKQDLVRGLPRSEENHIANGLVLIGDKIYINMGGHTNEGMPSNNFAELTEYALSAATLEIDLSMIGNSTYDIPTLDGPADQHDPFGGHDGLNQAMLVEDGPIQIFTSGLRNAYDIVYTEAGRFYTWDNGPNTGWGGRPGDDCLNRIDNGGAKSQDGLHLISRGYYAGHPNPTRGNKANTFGGQSPIEGDANPIECEYRQPGVDNGALITQNPSTNGLDEYTASNFGFAMKSDLLATAFNGKLYRVELNDAGNVVTSKSELADVGQSPLDVTTQGDSQIFPGTIWVADFNGKELYVLEPADY